MSPDYYTRLEQRRGPQPGEHMLASIARALRLAGDERTCLYRIAGHNAPASLSASAHVAPALLRVLDRLDDTPALVLTELGETLVQNRMATALSGDASRCTGPARSAIYRWFTDPAERLVYPDADRDRRSRARVANLRAAHGLRGPRSRAGDLVRTLQKASEEFAEPWERHEVAQRFEDHKTLIHSEPGAIELDCQALFTEDQSQTLLVLTAPPRPGPRPVTAPDSAVRRRGGAAVRSPASARCRAPPVRRSAGRRPGPRRRAWSRPRPRR